MPGPMSACRILSGGLYGILRPLDGIAPYRLELEYKLSGEDSPDLYDFWGDAIAKKLAKRGWIVNLASQEYFRVIGPFVKAERIIEPVFLSQMKADAEPGSSPCMPKWRGGRPLADPGANRRSREVRWL
ncbi:MAG: peroxide stress protein YaaA [Thermomicrobiales bacterium]